MKKAIATLFFTILAPSVSLAGSGSGKVLEVMVHDSSSGGVVLFRSEFNSDKAPCSTAGNGGDWAVSLESEFGKAVLATLLTARSQNASIHIKGASTCADWPDREKPVYVYLR
ncbi:hypothetical protein [Microbulbifer agarilyticus]